MVCHGGSNILQYFHCHSLKCHCKVFVQKDNNHFIFVLARSSRYFLSFSFLHQFCNFFCFFLFWFCAMKQFCSQNGSRLMSFMIDLLDSVWNITLCLINTVNKHLHIFRQKPLIKVNMNNVRNHWMNYDMLSCHDIFCSVQLRITRGCLSMDRLKASVLLLVRDGGYDIFLLIC